MLIAQINTHTRTITAAFLATQQHAPHSQHRAPQATTNLTIAHHNTRGLKNHTTDLIAFLQDTKPDIMTLNETFLRTPDKMFFPGYQPMARADRPNRHGGGVAILVRNGINFDVVNPIPTSRAPSNEQSTITIQTTTGTLHISTLYCPKGWPSREIIEGFCLGRDNVILTGDFNSKHESFGNKTRTTGGNLLQETIDDMNLTLTNDGTPTHTCDSTNVLGRTIKQYTRQRRQNNWTKYCNDIELSEGHNHAWRKLRSVINPKKRFIYPTLTTTDEHNNVTKHTTTEQKLDIYKRRRQNKLRR